MKLQLIEKEHLVDNVWVFRFAPNEPMPYTAGQFVYVELPHEKPDSQGTKRWFTNSAAPYQGILQITTRVTNSTFKQALSKLKINSQALQLIDKPDGDFVWQDSELPMVFIAAGIGITPFYSMLKQRAHDNQPLNVTLVYSGRTHDVPFTTEIESWQRQDSQFQVKWVIGRRLSAEKIRQLLPDLNRSLVYLSGPEPMVESVGDNLKANGLPEPQLKQDFFPNYSEENY